MATITIAGHVCVDLTPELNGSARLEPGKLVNIGPLSVSLGGCVPNTARALAHLGHPATAYATVGSDRLGQIVRAELARDLADPRLREVSQSTSYSLVLEPHGVDRTFWHHVGANALFDGEAILLDGVDLLHVGYPSLLPGLLTDNGAPLGEMLQRARHAGVTSSMDLAVVDEGSATALLNWRSLLQLIARNTDVLTPSLDDLRSVLQPDSDDDGHLQESFADLLLSWGAAVVVVSAGSRGLLLRTAGVERLRQAGRSLAPMAEVWAERTLRAPAHFVSEVRTTNGAGDASSAAILFGISRGLTPDQTLRLAVASSAAVVSGRPPTLEEVGRWDPELGRVLSSDPSPSVLPANQPPGRFYRGGAQIDRFRGNSHAQPFSPEDWVGSTVSVRDDPPAGMTRLADGTLLKDAIDAAPEKWLGRAHTRRFGNDPMFLLKLLDAGQRLPVHAHPDGAFASQHLGASHGKAEAWYILTPGVVYLGLHRDVSADELAQLVEDQDVVAMLALLNEVQVHPGDRVFVPAGTLHAIGDGVLLVEIQEPEDLSILLEWRDFAIDGASHGHLGLGFPTALKAVDHRAFSHSRLAESVSRAGAGGGGLPDAAAAHFRLDAVEVDGVFEVEPGFCILVGLGGSVELNGPPGLDVSRGRTVLIPAAAGGARLSGKGQMLIARPPKP